MHHYDDCSMFIVFVTCCFFLSKLICFKLVFVKLQIKSGIQTHHGGAKSLVKTHMLWLCGDFTRECALAEARFGVLTKFKKHLFCTWCASLTPHSPGTYTHRHQRGLGPLPLLSVSKKCPLQTMNAVFERYLATLWTSLVSGSLSCLSGL